MLSKAPRNKSLYGPRKTKGGRQDEEKEKSTDKPKEDKGK